MGNSIKVENAISCTDLPESEALIQWVDWILESEGQQQWWDISFIFVDDSYIIDLNKRFFQKTTATDIISFNLSEPKSAEGEVYISVETASTNADSFGVTLENELLRLIAHGVYHLLAYNDSTDEEKQIMTVLENKALDYIYSHLNFQQRA